MRKDISITVQGQKMVGVLEGPEGAKKLMILVHGFTGDMSGPNGTFKELSEKLQKEGYCVLRFNMRGTPPSEMDFTDMTVETETEDLKAAIGYARNVVGFSDIGLLGESMGGTIIMKGYDESIRAMVFWYSDFDFSDDAGYRELLGRKRELQEKGSIDLGEGFKMGRKFFDEMGTVNVYDMISNIKCPVLFMHGDSDIEVPLAQSEKAYSLAREPKELVAIKDVGHCFRLDDMKPHPSQDDAIEKTLHFLRRHF